MNLLTIFIFSMQMASDTCSNKKNLSKHYFASREDRPLFRILPTPVGSQHVFALSLLHDTFTQRARKYYPQEDWSVPKITLEGLRWVEGLCGGVIIWPSCALAEIPYQPKSKPRFLSSLFRKRYKHCMNKKEVILKSVVFFQSSSVIWSLMTNIKKYRWIRAALIE